MMEPMQLTIISLKDNRYLKLCIYLVYDLCHFVVIKCRAGQGVCPDTMISGGNGTQDVTNVTGIAIGGMRCIQYTRLLNTGISL